MKPLAYETAIFLPLATADKLKSLMREMALPEDEVIKIALEKLFNERENNIQQKE